MPPASPAAPCSPPAPAATTTAGRGHRLRLRQRGRRNGVDVVRCGQEPSSKDAHYRAWEVLDPLHVITDSERMAAMRHGGVRPFHGSSDDSAPAALAIE